MSYARINMVEFNSEEHAKAETKDFAANAVLFSLRRRDASGARTVFHIDEDGDEEVRFFKDEARVSFVAKVTPSDDDPKFGFFKRPNKVEVL